MISSPETETFPPFLRPKGMHPRNHKVNSMAITIQLPPRDPAIAAMAPGEKELSSGGVSDEVVGVGSVDNGVGTLEVGFVGSVICA